MISISLTSPDPIETVTILGFDFLFPPLPFPPQLPQALGFPIKDNQRLGIWREIEGVAVSDGSFIYVSPSSAWDAYCSSPAVLLYLEDLKLLGYNFLDNELDPCSNWGFLLDTDRLLIGEIKLIKYVVNHNPDPRPNWIKNAKPEDWKDYNWVKQFGNWQIERTAEFQKGLLACEPAINSMMEWLEEQQLGAK